MNKFSKVGQVSLLDELNYAKKLNNAKKRLEREVWSEFHLNTKATDSNSVFKEKKHFLLHPQRFHSESDTSNSSPRRAGFPSNPSNLNLELSHFIYEENKVRIILFFIYGIKLDMVLVENTKRKKKFHKHLTQTRKQCGYSIDMSIGDACSVTSSKHGGEKKIKNSAEILPNRRISSSKPAIRASQRNIISDSEFEKKFKIFVEKSLHTISDIRSLMEKGIDPPDGDEDTSRRLLRVKEFSNRFSRNYLYPIVRQLEDLNKLKSPSTTNPNQKLISAYQIVLNGLQAYYNHLPTSIGGCSADKLKLLLKHLLELCDVHSRMVKESDEHYSQLINTFKLNAELILQKIEDHFTAISTESVLKSTTKISIAQKKNIKNKPKCNIAERLSMYSTTSCFRRDPMWRKATQNLAMKKHNVQSRYKTALFRHRPPLEKIETQALTLPSKFRLFPKKSSAIFKKTPVVTPINEDSIMTMVEVEKNRFNKEEDENRNELEVNHEELVVKLLQLVLDNNRHREQQEINDDNEEKIADILEKLKNGADTEVLRKIVEGLQKKKANEGEGQLKLKVVENTESIEEVGVKRRKEPTVTITGMKNAKLICIKDENSIIETDEDIDPETKDCQNEKDVLLKPVSSSQTQTDFKEQSKRNKSTQRPPAKANMERLAKSSKCLQMLPKDYAVNIIQYKLSFHKYCKNNPMYRRTTNILPWILMGKISDEIVDLALLGVARKIEVNDIADQIYQSELQL